MADSDFGPIDFFISRAGYDRLFAQKLSDILTAAGYRTLIQNEHFGHRDFMDAMHEGLASGARVIACYSPNYFASDYSRAEAQGALTKDIFNRRQRLIPLRIAEVAPPGLFANIAYLDLVPVRARADETLLRDVLLAAVKPGARQQSFGPAAPLWIAPSVVVHRDIQPLANFTGRIEDLAQLKELLASGGQAAITAVSGLGGIGKSMLAREFAWRNRDDYAGVWWQIADRRETLIDELIGLGADGLFLPNIREVQDRAQAARWVLETIEAASGDKPWLLVYDNVEKPEQIDGLTPREGAQILLTSRWSDFYGAAQTLNLGVLSEPEAVALLVDGTGRKDATGALALARALGCLPLALEQAAAYMRGAKHVSFADYLARYNELLHLKPRGALAQRREGSQPRQGVWITFDLALKRVIEGDADAGFAPCPEAETLMGLLAFLHPDKIPLDIVTEEVMSDIEKGEAAASLSEVSLLSWETLEDGSHAVSVHRLVQEVMRERLAPNNPPLDGEGGAAGAGWGDKSAAGRGLQPRPQPSGEDLARGEAAGMNHGDGSATPVPPQVPPQAATALTLVARAFPNPAADVRNWPRCALLLPHAETVIGHVDKYYPPLDGEGGAAGAGWGDSLGVATAVSPHPNPPRQGEGERALPAALAAPLAHLLNQMFTYLYARADYAQAEPLMRRALAIDETSFGTDHPKVAIRLNNLAQLLKATNRLAEAEPLMRRALTIDETSFGTDHPEVAINLNNLAQLLQTTNRRAEAEPLLTRVVEIFEKVERDTGHMHPNYAGSLNNLALLLQDTNRLAEAEPLMRRALTIDETSFGTDHPNVAIDLNNLATLLQATNRLAEAEPLMRRALAIDETSYGPDHPDVARDLNNLAQLLKATNRLAEAEPLMRRALAIDETSFGTDHPEVATDLNNLAQLLQATNRLAEAEPLMRRALTIDETSFGPDHPKVAIRLNNLATLLQATNRLAEAEPLMRRAVAIVEASLPDHHPWVQGARANLAGIRAELAATRHPGRPTGDPGPRAAGTAPAAPGSRLAAGENAGSGRDDEGESELAAAADAGRGLQPRLQRSDQAPPQAEASGMNHGDGVANPVPPQDAAAPTRHPGRPAGDPGPGAAGTAPAAPGSRLAAGENAGSGRDDEKEMPAPQNAGAADWFIERDGLREGPLTLAQVWQRRETKTLLATDRVWHPVARVWVTADRLKWKC
jgi:tetratricopeptide (TPR) repeat protein